MSRGKAPAGVWRRNPQKLNVFFFFSDVNVALKRGEAATISERFSSSDDLTGNGAGL
jgi:hypothetical protein